MELRRIHLQNFKRFGHLDLELASGLNVIRGPNEAGKSTIQDAIVLGLFDRPTGKRSEQSYRSWGKEGLYRIELTFESSDGKMITVRKDYDATTWEVEGPGGSDTSREGLEETIREAVGTLSRDMFVSTACIRQDAMTELKAGQKEISSQLQEIVTGGDETTVDGVISKLESTIADLARGWKTTAARNPGPIKQLMDEFEKNATELKVVDEDVSRWEEDSERRVEILGRIPQIEGDLEPKSQALKVHEQKQQLRGKRQEQEKAEGELKDRIERARKADQGLKKAEEEMLPFRSLDRLDDMALPKLREKHSQLIALEGKAEGVRAQLDEVERRISLSSVTPRASRPRLAPIVTLVGSLLVVLAGVLLIAIRPLVPGLGELLVFAGSVGVVAGLVWLVSSNRRPTPDQKTHADATRKLLNELQADAGRLRAELEEYLGSIGYSTWQGLEASLDKYAKLRSVHDKIEGERTGVLGEEDTLEGLEQRYKLVSKQRWDTEERLQELASAPELSAVEYQSLLADVDRLSKEKKSLEEESLRLSGRGEVLHSTIEDKQELEEKRASLEHRLDGLTDKYETWSVTLEVMRDARQATMRRAQDDLAPRMGAYLNRLTEGRYSELVVDEDLEPHVVHDSKPGETISGEELSEGAKDQLYLAARLALCDLVFRDSRPPLLMDDPFVKFDPQRRAAALRLCRELAKDRQIILFTCQSDFDESADKVMFLESL